MRIVQFPQPSHIFISSTHTVYSASISITMSTVRRSKAMPTDGPTAKFLYTILKQLDLKSVSILSPTKIKTSLY